MVCLNGKWKKVGLSSLLNNLKGRPFSFVSSFDLFFENEKVYGNVIVHGYSYPYLIMTSVRIVFSNISFD